MELLQVQKAQCRRRPPYAVAQPSRTNSRSLLRRLRRPQTATLLAALNIEKRPACSKGPEDATGAGGRAWSD